MSITDLVSVRNQIMKDVDECDGYVFLSVKRGEESLIVTRGFDFGQLHDVEKVTLVGNLEIFIFELINQHLKSRDSSEDIN